MIQFLLNHLIYSYIVVICQLSSYIYHLYYYNTLLYLYTNRWLHHMSKYWLYHIKMILPDDYNHLYHLYIYWLLHHFTYGYGSIPINTIFRGMNIHLPAILMWTTGVLLVLTHCHINTIAMFSSATHPPCRSRNPWRRPPRRSSPGELCWIYR